MPLSGRQHHLRPPPGHRRARRAAHDPQEPVAFRVGDLPNPYPFSHHTPRDRTYARPSQSARQLDPNGGRDHSSVAGHGTSPEFAPPKPTLLARLVMRWGLTDRRRRARCPTCRTPQPRPIPRGVLGEPLAAGTAEPTGRAVEASDRPGRLDGAHALERRSGRQIGEAVVVEVAGRQREAEEVERLGPEGYARGVLGEQLAAGAVESGGRAIANNDRPGCLAGRGIIGLAGRRRAASRRGLAAGSICWERVLR
jgi:hypothetical protein